MKIIIKEVLTRQETTQNDKLITKQCAALADGGPFPLPFWFTIQPDNPYQPGEYTFAPGTFKLNPWQGLELDRYNFRLQPLVAEARKAS